MLSRCQTAIVMRTVQLNHRVVAIIDGRFVAVDIVVVPTRLPSIRINMTKMIARHDIGITTRIPS